MSARTTHLHARRRGRTRSAILGTLLPTLALIGTTGLSGDAQACGCFSPPLPPPGALDGSDYAVNQQAESILFEVEPGFVTAHVLIRYAGDPQKFAWIVPVPSPPELSLSTAATFGIMEQATQPLIQPAITNVCPTSEFICQTHPAPYCPERWAGMAAGGSASFAAGAGGSSAAPGDAGAGSAPPVKVISREQVGSYDTVTFSAGDAQAAIEWLQEEGFIVNDTMAPYMQPYVDMGMLLVASKLIPGAAADEIRPLRMRFEADMPMVPLQLTAVAAEPHLTVTAYILSNEPFKPLDLPLVTLNPEDVARDPAGRLGYPMQLSRAIDESGGNGFVREYVGTVPSGLSNTGASYCCGSPGSDLGLGGEGGFDTPDFCGLGNDGQCQCPTASFDQPDCEESAPGLLEGILLAEELSAKYSTLTRLTTRLSPEEMTFDPAFVPDPDAQPGVLLLQGQQLTLAACEADIIDVDSYAEIQQLNACSSIYCGQGECAATQSSAGCICEPGFVGRSFVDLDGLASVTCIPENGTVDLSAGGLELPSACQSVSCGEGGSCRDIGGFPTCQCEDGYAAVTGPEGEIRCERVEVPSGNSGAFNYTRPLADVEVCSPRPSDCGAYGWLVPNPNNIRPGVLCASSMPDPSEFEIPPEPTCEDFYGGQAVGGTASGGGGASSEGGSVEYPFDDVREYGCSCSQAGVLARGESGGSRALLAVLFALIAWLRMRAGGQLLGRS